MNKNENKLLSQLGSDRHPYISSSEELVKKIKGLFSEIKLNLKRQADEYEQVVKDDEILSTITKLFNLRVGRKYSEDELDKIFKDGKVRYDKKIPPGYEDAKIKEDDRKFSDLVIWYQIIEFAKEKKKPIILITAEQKEDWWYKYKGKIIGPCPELIEEIHEKANVIFHMYRVDPFLKYSQKYLDTQIQKKTFDELKAVRNAINHLKDDNEKINEIIKKNEIFKILGNSLKIEDNIINSKILDDIITKNEQYNENMGLLAPLFINDKMFKASERIRKANERINVATEKSNQIKELEDRIERMNLLMKKNDGLSGQDNPKTNNKKMD